MSAIAAGDVPGCAGLDEKPKPGSDGTTTSKASFGFPPKRAGSVSMGMSSMISTKEPGQP